MQNRTGLPKLLQLQQRCDRCTPQLLVRCPQLRSSGRASVVQIIDRSLRAEGTPRPLRIPGLELVGYMSAPWVSLVGGVDLVVYHSNMA